MMKKKTYSEKLKDPRWQKLRLKVFERDEFHCQVCGDDESPLAVHHLIYMPNHEPWEYPLENFMTLCESCHQYDYETRGEYEKQLLDVIKQKGFMADDVQRIVNGFLKLRLPYPPEVTASIIEFALSDAFQVVAGLFWVDVENKAGKRREAKNEI
jgi:hypothetical protein